jgi:putative serine protease PepD
VSSNALVAAIRGYQPGETITLTYQRDGKESTAKVKLESDGGKLGS